MGRKRKDFIIDCTAKKREFDLSGIDKYIENRYAKTMEADQNDGLLGENDGFEIDASKYPIVEITKVAQEIEDVATKAVEAINHALHRPGVDRVNIVASDSDLFFNVVFPEWLNDPENNAMLEWMSGGGSSYYTASSENQLVGILRQLSNELSKRPGYLVVRYVGPLGDREITPRIKKESIAPSKLILVTESAIPEGLANVTLNITDYLDTRTIAEDYLVSAIAQELYQLGLISRQSPDDAELNNIDVRENDHSTENVGIDSIFEDLLPQFAENIQAFPRLRDGAILAAMALEKAYDPQGRYINKAVFTRRFRAGINQYIERGSNAGVLQYVPEDDYLTHDKYIWFSKGAQEIANIAETIISMFPKHRIPTYLRSLQGERAKEISTIPEDEQSDADAFYDTQYPEVEQAQIYPYFLLVSGAPGVGKSLIARVLPTILKDGTGEPFRVATASFVNARGRYVGETEGRVRDLLNRILHERNLVVLLDEFNMMISDPSLSTVQGGAEEVNAGIVAELQSFFENNRDELMRNHIVIISTGNPEYNHRIPPALKSRGTSLFFAAPKKLDDIKQIVELEFKKQTKVDLPDVLAYFNSPREEREELRANPAKMRALGEKMLDDAVRSAIMGNVGTGAQESRLDLGMSPRDIRSAMEAFVRIGRQLRNGRPGFLTRIDDLVQVLVKGYLESRVRERDFMRVHPEVAHTLMSQYGDEYYTPSKAPSGPQEDTVPDDTARWRGLEI